VIEKGRSNNKSLYMLLGICVAILAGTAYGAYSLFFGNTEKAQPTAAKTVASAPEKATEETNVKTENAKPAPAATKEQTPLVEPATSVKEEANKPAPAAPTKAEAKPAATAPEAAKQQYSILIKKSEFKVKVLDRNKNIVESFDCALGKNPGDKQRSGDMKTPNGTFKVTEVCDASYWTHDFKDGKGEIKGAYGPWFFYLDTNDKSKGQWDGIGIHGTHDPSSMRTLASEGCIRVLNENVLKLEAKYIRKGTMVTIEE